MCIKALMHKLLHLALCFSCSSQRDSEEGRMSSDSLSVSLCKQSNTFGNIGSTVIKAQRKQTNKKKAFFNSSHVDQLLFNLVFWIQNRILHFSQGCWKNELMIKAWPLSWLYHIAAGTMLRGRWDTNVKTKRPLLTEAQIKKDFDVCGSTCLLCSAEKRMFLCL